STHQLGKRLVAAANAGEEVAVRFVEAIRSGPSTAFLAECYELSKGFRHIQTPTYRQGARQFRWFSHYEYPQKPGKDWAYALIVMRLVNAKVTDRIKQCANVQCDRYFYGDPRRR